MAESFVNPKILGLGKSAGPGYRLWAPGWAKYAQTFLEPVIGSQSGYPQKISRETSRQKGKLAMCKHWKC